MRRDDQQESRQDLLQNIHNSFHLLHGIIMHKRNPHDAILNIEFRR